MVRLLRRARDRRSDPLLFAGLTHACRYCGLLQASLAAWEHAVRLDPKVPTSVGHTFFMRGDYAQAIEHISEPIPYTANLALVMLGRDEEARASLESIDVSHPSRMVHYTSALLHAIRGEREQGIAEIVRQVDIPDPEGHFYIARQLVHLGDIDRGLDILSHVVDDGFFCLPALTRDPWLDPIRQLPAFTEIVRRAETRHRRAIISFLSAEGDRVLGVPYPV